MSHPDPEMRTHKKRRESDVMRDKRIATHPRREARRKDAAVRQEARNLRPDAVQIAFLEAEGFRGGREWARLTERSKAAS